MMKVVRRDNRMKSDATETCLTLQAVHATLSGTDTAGAKEGISFLKPCFDEFDLCMTIWHDEISIFMEIRYYGFHDFPWIIWMLGK